MQVGALMEEFHPKEPHWYLPMIGVDPSRHPKIQQIRLIHPRADNEKSPNLAIRICAGPFTRKMNENFLFHEPD